MKKSSLSMAEPVGFLFLHSIVNLVLIKVQKFILKLLPLNCPSPANHDMHCSKTTQSDPISEDLALRREDLELVMEMMGMNIKEEGDRLDEQIEFEELADMFTDNEPCLEEVKEAFCVFDEGGDGFIDALELQRALSKLGFSEDLALEACVGMIAVYDENRDGRIDFIEFVKLMERSFC